MTFNACAVVPVFNHHACLNEVVAGLRAHGLPVILVDDGSAAETQQVLASLATKPEVECLTLPHNQGKGAAVLAGFERAAEQGFSHALQVDADGQHDLADVPALLDLAEAHPDHLVSGQPEYDDSVPAARFYGRYLTHALIWFDTLSLTLHDSMCGFRVYPLEPSLALHRRVRIGRRMDFDTDLMTRLYWAGTESLFVSTHVRYPEEGTSNFRMFRDNVRMTWLHLRLFGGLWHRAPSLLKRTLRRQRTHHWARIGERGSLIGIRFIGCVDRVLGRTVCCLMLTPVIAYFMTIHGHARRASKQFLQAAGLKPTIANRFRQLMNFAVSILDKVRAWRSPEQIDLDFTACRPLLDQIATGRGALLLTVHVGNAEVSRALAYRVPDLRINALVYSDNSAIANTMLGETNADYPLQLIQVTDMGPDTALLLRDKIDAGEVVVIAADRVPVGDRSPMAEVDFLGRPATLALGPYILAHVLECPVYLFICARQGKGYKIHMEPFAERIQLRRGGRNAAAQQWASRFAERLAEYARRFPLQWYNFYDFWAKHKITNENEAEESHAKRAA